MKSIIKISAIAILVFSGTVPLAAQTLKAYDSEKEEFRSKKLSGPRLGMTYAVPDGKKLEKTLRENDMGNFMSQFGWHFEWLVEPKTGNGPAFVIEAVPFIGGVEYGTIVPSGSLVMGVRLPSGFEFGMGPMAYFTGDEEEPVGSSLVLAVGKSLDYSGVSIPLNLAVATSPEGTRLSFVFGYAMSK